MKFRRPNRPTLISFILALIVGFLLVTQFFSAKKVAEMSDADFQQNLALEVGILAKSNEDLRTEIDTLEKEQREYDQALSKGVDSATVLESSLTRYEVISGLQELKGEGVVVTIEGPLLDVHLLDLLNNLRNIGVEGISLNGQRIIFDSFLRSQDLQVRLDGVPLASPYRFEAIGKADLLASSLNREGGLLEQLKETLPDLKISVEEKNNITLIPYQGDIRFEYAKAVD